MSNGNEENYVFVHRSLLYTLLILFTVYQTRMYLKPNVHSQTANT